MATSVKGQAPAILVIFHWTKLIFDLGQEIDKSNAHINLKETVWYNHATTN